MGVFLSVCLCVVIRGLIVQLSLVNNHFICKVAQTFETDWEDLVQLLCVCLHGQ